MMRIRLKILGISVNRNRYATILLSSAVWFIPLRTLLIELGNMFHVNGRYLSGVSIVMFFVFVVLPVLPYLNYTRSFLGWFAFVGLSWTVSLVFHVKYSEFWLSEAVRIFIRALPFFLIVQNIDDWTAAKKLLYRSGVITIIIMLIYTVIAQFTGTLFEEEKMYNQYNGMITAGAATLCILAFLEEKKILYLMMTVISTILIVIFGARMPIACILLGFGLYFCNRIRGKLKVTWKNIAFAAVVFGGIIFVGVAVAKLQSMHFSHIYEGQRIIYQISNGEFFQSSGRSEIAAAVVGLIHDRPLTGYGMISDRIPIALEILGAESKFTGTYSHNLFLEFWLQYGVVLGTVLIVIVVYTVYRLIFRNDFTEDKKMIAIWAVSMTFGILFFSGPNYSQKEFWIMLGMGSPYLVKFGLDRHGRNQERIR